MEEDPCGQFDKARRILTEFGMSNVANEDFYALRHVCEIVSSRGAYLIAASCAALLTKMGRKDVSIAVNGDLYYFHPFFATKVETRIQILMGKDLSVKLFEQDSWIGGALIAANLK